MNLSKTFTLSMGLLFLGNISFAQDPSFSQFYAGSTYLNPAITALRSGITVNSAYRNQWFGIQKTKGFETYTASVEAEVPFLFGMGLSVLSDKEGHADYKTTAARLSFSKAVPLSSKMNLHAGMSTGYMERSIDWSKLVFSDQLDPTMGLVQNSKFAYDNTKIITADFSGGLALRWDWGIRARKTTYDSHHMLGFSIHHPFKQSESLQHYDSTDVPTRFTIHYGAEINTNIKFNNQKNQITWSPNIKYDRQQSLDILTAGTYLIMQPAFVGAFYQNQLNPVKTGKNTATVIFVMGTNMAIGKESTMQLGLSYDMHLSGFDIASNRSGTIEMTASINFGNAGLFGLGFGGGSGGHSGAKFHGKSKKSGSKQVLKCQSFF
jgi:type IX secretion system PorP/SprF family membrane protein